MKNKQALNWQVIIGLVLIILSTSLYLLHYLIFKDARHIFMYLLGDLAFVFIEVLLVTLVLHGLLNYRDKKAMLKKLNMVIGVFFSEVGTELIKFIVRLDKNSSGTAKHLIVTKDWTDQEFARVKKEVLSHACNINLNNSDLIGLKDFLIKKRQFLLVLLENSNLLEHESFSNLLWAVFHLTEELSQRKDLQDLPKADLEHLCIDVKRVQELIIIEWLNYMNHLSQDYPYLFSLAMRMNPFDANASVALT